MKRVFVVIVMLLLVSSVLSNILVSVQEAIYYHKTIFKVIGISFYINMTYIFKNPDPRVDKNNTISYVIKPYNSTHFNVSSTIVYYVYYFYYKPQIRRIERNSWWFMEYDRDGYITLEYNGSTIPTFNISTYSRECNLIDNSISRIMNAQFSVSNMIDVKVKYSGFVKEVDGMLCLNNSGKDDDVVVMGGFAEDIERYWFVIAYIPIIIVLVAGIGYFIEKKLLTRKLSKPK